MTIDKPKRQERLLVGIKKIIGQYKDNYGARRIHLTLIQEGETVSYSTVYRIMNQNGLIKKVKRHSTALPAKTRLCSKENLINRDFTAKHEWHRPLLQQCQNGELLCNTEKREAISNSD